MKKKLLVENNSFTRNPPVSDSSPQGDSKNTQLFGQHNSAKAQPSLDTNSKPRFLYRSLAMDWAQMCRGQAVVNGASPTGPH